MAALVVGKAAGAWLGKLNCLIRRGTIVGSLVSGGHFV
jgi:hypothetical protein